MPLCVGHAGVYKLDDRVLIHPFLHTPDGLDVLIHPIRCVAVFPYAPVELALLLALGPIPHAAWSGDHAQMVAPMLQAAGIDRWVRFARLVQYAEVFLFDDGRVDCVNMVWRNQLFEPVSSPIPLDPNDLAAGLMKALRHPTV